MRSKLYSLCALLLFPLCLCGCALLQREPALATYTSDAGISLQMFEGMSETALDGVTCYFGGQNCMMSAVRESFADYEALGYDTASMTLEEYAALVQAGNALEMPFTADENGNLHVTYENTVGNNTFFYYATVRRGSDAFWVVNFACRSFQQETFLPHFIAWSNTIVLE